MTVPRDRSVSPDHGPREIPRATSWRRACLAALALSVALASTATPAHAESPYLARLLSRPLAADTLPVPAPEGPRMLLSARTWALVRESMHRLLEPDTRGLRYVTRYRVSSEMADKIVEEAIAAGIDPELAFRLVRVESRFDAGARSPVGALGLMQLMPSTARRLDRSLQSEDDILDPRTNLRLGLRYLRIMIDRYGDVRLGLLAYNRGPNAVDRAIQQGADPENGYSDRVLGRGLNRYQGSGVLHGATLGTARD
jgi:soluble lytic murein transglycosylase-like protein